jgi:hypothetical protein
MHSHRDGRRRGRMIRFTTPEPGVASRQISASMSTCRCRSVGCQIPTGNPHFLSRRPARIWAFGLRNPGSSV